MSTRVRFPGRTTLPPVRSGAVVICSGGTCRFCGRAGPVLSPSQDERGACVPCLERALELAEQGHEHEPPTGPPRRLARGK